MKGLTIAVFVVLSRIPGVLPQRPEVVVVQANSFQVR